MMKLNLFNQLINQLDQKCPHGQEDYKYIGTGNPNAKILIIGKEASISKAQGDQFSREFKSNFEQWKEIKDFDQNKVKDCDWVNHTPLYPYKGQLLKINNNINCGTSRTWFNYQKLINLTFHTPENDKINFHEKVFITEVNSSPSPKTVNADTSSIGFRKEVLFKSAFVNDFPVIIIAGVGYFEISKDRNEIGEIFKVEFKELKFADGKITQPYWIHYNKDRNKLLINTHQLSMNVSDALLQEIAEVIRKFIKTTEGQNPLNISQ